MELFKKIPTEFDGLKYEVRVLYDKRTINVAAFRDNHPANPYRYQAQVPKGCDPLKILKKHPVDELVEACKRQLADESCQNLSAAMRECAASGS